MTRLLSERPGRAGVGSLTLRTAAPHRRVLTAGLLATMLASTLAIVMAALVGRLADAALDRDRDTAVSLSVVGIALAVVQTVATGYGQSWLARAGEYVVRDLRDTMALRLLLAPLRFVERHRAGDLVQRGTAEVAALSTFVRDSLGRLVTTATTLVAAVVVLALESWQLLAAVLVGFAPASWWVMRRFRRVAGPAFAAEAAAEADVMAGVAEVVRTRSVLRQATAQGRRHFLAAIDRRGERALAAQLRTVVVARWVNAMAVVEGLSLAVLVGVGAWSVAHASISVGVVVTFVLAARTLFTSITDLSELVGDAEEVATGLARVHDLLEATAATPRPPAALLDRRLVADGVVFGYGGDVVLDGVELTVAPGDRVCVVGRTGSGKSTLAKVLAGLYAPDAGTVRLGGVELCTLEPGQRAALVAYVPQQVQLGAGTIRDELLLVDGAATDERLDAAACAVGLGPWLHRLAAGLDTRTDELSAGERQLVGLLRVALSPAAVLVLDEASSDLDPATAAATERALDELAADRAVVVVAHRPETIACYDRVLELGGSLSAG